MIKFLLFSSCIVFNCFATRYSLFNASPGTIQVSNIKNTDGFDIKRLEIDPLGGTINSSSNETEINVASNEGIILETTRNYRGKVTPHITVSRINDNKTIEITLVETISNSKEESPIKTTQNFSQRLLAAPYGIIEREHFDDFKKYATRTYNMIVVK